MKIYIPQIRYLDLDMTAKDYVHEDGPLIGFKTREEANERLKRDVGDAKIEQHYPDDSGGGFWFTDEEMGEARACIRVVEIQGEE